MRGIRAKETDSERGGRQRETEYDVINDFRSEEKGGAREEGKN